MLRHSLHTRGKSCLGPPCSAPAFPKGGACGSGGWCEWFGPGPTEPVPTLSPVVATIAGMDATIRAYDSEIEQMAEERYPETQLLRQVAGVGLITATTFVLTVEDPTRFPRSLKHRLLPGSSSPTG